MNLVSCNEHCIHQEDGCCTLNGGAQVSGCKVDGCCYFSPHTPPKKPNEIC